MSDRRRFLDGLVAAATTLAFAPGTLLGANAIGPSGNGSLVRSDRERFEARLNRWFSFQDPLSGTRHRLQLVAVRPGPSAPHLDQFSLIFRGNPASPAPAGTYWVSDEAGDGFPLFTEAESAVASDAACRADFCLFRQS